MKEVDDRSEEMERRCKRYWCKVDTRSVDGKYI